MKRTTKSRVLRAAGIMLATLLLVGCNAIPSAGPVKVGLTDLEQAEQFFQFNPVGPIEGSSQEDIVRGFVLAATSSADDYSVAREYLAADYVEQWDPDYGVLIDDGSRPYRSDGEDAGILSLAAVAKVDSNGLLLPVEPGPTTDMRFEFERVDNEWRIASAPAGIILDRTTFTAIWSSHELNFIGAGGYLVPETRWFLRRAAIVTEVVGALLEGPGERMSNSVHSGIPTGTTLVSGAVPIVEGRAKIDLSGDLLQAAPDTLNEIYLQFKQTLQGIAGVSGFDLLVDGTSLRVAENGLPSAPPSATDVANPSVLADDTFGTLIGGELREMAGLSAPIVGLDPDAITLARDETFAVVRNADGVSRVDAENITLVDGRADQIAPSIDMLGFVWTAQKGAVNSLQVTAADGSVVQVSAPWLDGRQPVAVRLSPDGTRIAALVPSGEDSAVLVAGVIRDDAGMPLQTTAEADTQLWTTGSPLDFDWIDQVKFAALTDLGNASKVTVSGPGIFSSEQGSVPGGRQLSGGGIRSQLRVLGLDGDLYASQGSGWQRGENEVDVLAKRD